MYLVYVFIFDNNDNNNTNNNNDNDCRIKPHVEWCSSRQGVIAQRA